MDYAKMTLSVSTVLWGNPQLNLWSAELMTMQKASTAATIRLVRVCVPLRVMVLAWVIVLFACFVPPGFSETDILNKVDERSYISKQIWSRRINENESGTVTFQTHGRQVQRCQGPNRMGGQCVPVEACVLPDVYRDYVKNKDYFCVLRNQGGIGVCCPDKTTFPMRYQEGIFSHPRQTRSPAKPPKQKQKPPTTTASKRIPATSEESALHSAYPLGDWRVCGRNRKQMSQITSIGPTTLKDWPWMAVFVHRPPTLTQFCGGTVITKRHVLTAAHCFDKEKKKPDPREALVLLGEYDLEKKDDSKIKVSNLSQIIVHEDYDPSTFEHDIAIVVLNSDTIYNSFIQPCCLPAPGPRYPNVTAVVAGWGMTEFNGSSSSILMEAQVPVWEQQRCVPNFPSNPVFDTNLCAGAFEGGIDSCRGDSGGPLVTQRNDGRWTVVGVVSWGVRCGEKNKPGIYTRVNDYLDWISQAIL